MNRSRHEPFELGWDCDATLIPSGRSMTLREGERVVIVQALGGTITVQTDNGYLARISSEDAHRLGLDTQLVSEEVAASGIFDMERVIEQLKTVFDPEIPINVVDLGLIYECDAYELADGSHRVEIKMSMTAPGCGMGDVLRDDARSRVRMVSGVSDVDVELVWDPPWDLSRMSDVARLELGMF